MPPPCRGCGKETYKIEYVWECRNPQCSKSSPAAIARGKEAEKRENRREEMRVG